MNPHRIYRRDCAVCEPRDTEHLRPDRAVCGQCHRDVQLVVRAIVQRDFDGANVPVAYRTAGADTLRVKDLDAIAERVSAWLRQSNAILGLESSYVVTLWVDQRTRRDGTTDAALVARALVARWTWARAVLP